MKRDWYSDWFGTRYYKLLYGHRNNEEAQPLVHAIIQHCQMERGAAVWDMACGRGRHLYWFHEAGMTVHGTDLSSDSIAEASLNVPDADLSVHDMRDPVPYLNMDLTANLFTSFGYFEDQAHDQLVLHRGYESLRVGGYFVLDFLNAESVAARLVPASELSVGEVEFNIHRLVRDGMIIKDIHIRDGGSEMQFTEKVRAYDADELISMFQIAGFVEVNAFGENFSEPVRGSDRCVVVGRKK